MIETTSQYQVMLDEIKAYIKSEFRKNIDLQFHSLEHVSNVAKWAVKLGEMHQLTERNLLLLELAAWLHDLGFKECYTGHEVAGSQMIADLLESKLSTSEIETIQNCVNATKMPQQPQNLMEEILCDADLAHLGSVKYYDWLEKLREEWVESLGKSWSDNDWYEFNINFLIGHKYHTHVAQELLEPVKQENIKELKRRIKVS